MDLREPGLAFSGTLSVPILRALAARSTPASAAQVTRILDSATLAGVRRALDRLVVHGVCTGEEIGGRTVFSLNSDHVLRPAIDAIRAADKQLISRLRRSVGDWPIAPLSVILYGSAARRDGNVDSDIDLLLVRPSMEGALKHRKWNPMVHALRGQVKRWTGNDLQVVDWTMGILRHAVRDRERRLDDVERDGITVFGSSIQELMETRKAEKIVSTLPAIR